jgi:polysaccharide export outer membrane protein
MTKPGYRSKALLLLGVLALISGCAGTNDRVDEATRERVDRTDTVDHRKAPPGDVVGTLEINSRVPLFDSYRIAPGDVLDVVYHLQRRRQEHYPITLYHTVSVRFVHVPELSQTQEVLPDGTISLPHLGRYKVEGKTVEELRQELEKAYSGTLRDPDIYVSIENFNARVEQIRQDLRTSARGLSKLITVRPDGRATFPLIGPYEVAGRTVEDVHQELADRYQQYMAGLKLDLFMHEQSGTNIYVVGEVRQPGEYEIKRPINLIQAVARAGGYTQQGETSSVIVFRRDDKRLKAHRFDIKDMDTFGAQAINFYLQPEDILLVPRSRISSLAQLMREISDITFFQGFDIGFDAGNIDVRN